VVVIGEGMAIAACIMAVLFILASLGRPDRLWHILPFIGRMNLPRSMLAWDVVVINSYLFLNVLMLSYILYKNYVGREPNLKMYSVGVIVAIGLAISIHTVTAFLFSSNVSRPYWHSAIVGPRFLASAFTSGPALMILALQVIHANTRFKVDATVIGTLAVIMTATLQVNMFLLGVEMYTEFYSQTKHASSIQYLFFGLHGHTALVPWIWTSIVLNVIAVVMLTIHPIRRTRALLNLACVMTIVGIWIEKGMGLVIPGFIPTPLGDIVEYMPTFLEISVCLGIWAIGAMIFILIVKMVIPVELGLVKH
jgi:molybdopterin-containing oxidoreductase family membrane subunit